MTIRRLLKTSSLPPEGVDRLIAAYQQTLRSLDLVDRHDPIAEIVAKKVIEIGKRGGDAVEIAKLAVSELAVQKGHHSPDGRVCLRGVQERDRPSGLLHLIP